MRGQPISLRRPWPRRLLRETKEAWQECRTRTHECSVRATPLVPRWNAEFFALSYAVTISSDFRHAIQRGLRLRSEEHVETIDSDSCLRTAGSRPEFFDYTSAAAGGESGADKLSGRHRRSRLDGRRIAG